MNSTVREISAEESRRLDQLKVHGLACRWFWESFDASLTSLVDRCEDLAHSYCPMLWDQYAEGLVTASEFLNKLMDEMTHTNGRPMSPIDQAASIALLDRANGACRKFAKNSARPIGDFLDASAVPVGATIENGAYHYCHMIGSRLSDLDRDECQQKML